MKNNLELILNQPAYWVEAINGALYNAIVDYMDKNDLNQTQLATMLGISPGRVSQILNDGQINYSIEKMVEIAIKVGKFPTFEFENADSYIHKLEKSKNTTVLTLDNLSEYARNYYPLENIDKKSNYSDFSINPKIAV